MNLKEKVLIITGARSGIGGSCVKKLLGLGVIVAGFDRNQGEITDQNYRHYIVDVRDEKGIKASVDDVESSFGGIDALVNSAGIFSSSKPFYQMDLEEWEKVISTNLTG